VPILVLLGLSVLDLGQMYATDRQTSDRQTDVRRASSLNAPYLRGGGIIITIETFNLSDVFRIYESPVQI